MFLLCKQIDDGSPTIPFIVSWNASPRNQAMRNMKLKMMENSTIQLPQIQQPTFEDAPLSPERVITENTRVSPHKADSGAQFESPPRNVMANSPVSRPRNVCVASVGSPSNANCHVSPQRTRVKETIVLVSTYLFYVLMLFDLIVYFP